jgi:hypothetical protein
VSHFSGGEPKAPGFAPEWAWTGDQGLLLGGIADTLFYYGVTGWSERALWILDGAKANLVDGSNILRPWSGSGTDPEWLPGFLADYETGVGVFWRYALYVWTKWGALRPHINEKAYRQFVKDNADAAVSGKGWSGENPPFDSVAPFDSLTNQLAVLLMAIAMTLDAG